MSWFDKFKEGVTFEKKYGMVEMISAKMFYDDRENYKVEDDDAPRLSKMTASIQYL